MKPPLLHLPARGASAHELGGKGANLQRLNELGAPVPPAFVILSDAYRAHVTIPTVRQHLDAAIGAEPGSRGARWEALRQAIAAQPLEPGLRRALADALEALGPGPFAVRSSAIGEDGASCSFAGQHDTVLGVDGLDAVEAAVRQCWASAWTTRAVEYRARQGLDPRGVAMAVVVQRLVPSEVSGVLFTCDPVSGRADRVTIEAVYGLGEALVSGRLAPDRWVLSRPGLAVLERTHAEKPFALVADGAGLREQALAPERARTPCLDDAMASKLAEEALRLEGALGGPQDIEWAIARGRPFILQARPVTAAAPARAGPRLVWSNTNTAEVLPDVATPMTFSIIRRYVTRLLGMLLLPLGIDLERTPLLGQIGGRVYFCMNTFMGLMRAVPGMSRASPAELFGGDAERLGEALASLRPDEIPALHVSRWRALRTAPGLVLRLLRHLNVRGDRYVARARARTRALAAVDPSRLSDAELADRYDLLLADLFTSSDALSCGVVGLACANGLSALCRRWLGDEDGSLRARLLSGMGGLDSAEAGLDLWRLAQAARAPGVAEEVLAGRPFARTRERLAATGAGAAFLELWDEYLARHGHHARGELDVYTPRWREEPDAVLATVRAFLTGDAGADPVALHQRRGEEREMLAALCRHRLGPIRGALFGWLLARAHRGFATRENIKSEAVRRLALVRESLFEAGRRLRARGRLGEVEDVFFLDLDELRDELRGAPRDEAVRSIPRRRRDFTSAATLRPPPVVVGDYEPDQQARDEAPAVTGRLRGLAVSPGVAVGRARVVLRADPDQRVKPGEILVAPFTDPGWTPYFVAAAAVVVDVGGMLSHGSVVAREYGIPAVVNVVHGTRALSTGQLIQVDGFRGEVTVLPEGGAPQALPGAA